MNKTVAEVIVWNYIVDHRLGFDVPDDIIHKAGRR